MKLMKMIAFALVLAFPASLTVAQEVLPRPEQPFGGRIGLTAQDSVKDFPKEVEAPKGAPNILIILTDDVGFGASSTFGGPIPTATMDRLAKAGLRYNNFHTTALCSPTRAALLDRAESSQRCFRSDHGGRHGLPRLQHARPEERRNLRRSAEAERLQHRLVWQEPQRPRLAWQPGRTV